VCTGWPLLLVAMNHRVVDKSQRWNGEYVLTYWFSFLPWIQHSWNASRPSFRLIYHGTKYSFLLFLLGEPQTSHSYDQLNYKRGFYFHPKLYHKLYRFL